MKTNIYGTDIYRARRSAGKDGYRTERCNAGKRLIRRVIWTAKEGGYETIVSPINTTVSKKTNLQKVRTCNAGEYSWIFIPKRF